MCGISGQWNFSGKPIDRPAFEAFTDSLSHRGPDGRGTDYLENGTLALGHRRLAILDLSENGHQPKRSSDGRFTITYNGEIYNFLELRDSLKREGFRFETETDTEVVLAAYERYGLDCLEKFNGMWAFAIWDAKEKKLVLARDRFGVKPLQFYLGKNFFAFASETKAFVANAGVPLEWDDEAITLGLRRPAYVDRAGLTLIKDVKKLMPGHALVAQVRSGQLKIESLRWWDTLRHLVRVPKSYPEQVEQFAALFEDAVRLRMRSDVALGTALSGGLDSSSVIAMMAEVKKKAQGLERTPASWQEAIVASFPGTSQDETRYAETVANSVGARLHVVEPDLELEPETLTRCVYDLEEIFDLPIGPWTVYRAFRQKKIVVSMDGHGGDELLGGYPHYCEVGYREASAFPPNLLRMHRYQKVHQGLCEEGPARPPLRYFSSLARAEEVVSSSLQFKVSALNLPDSGEVLPASWSAVDRRLYLDFHRDVLPTILRNFDRCSMAHGVEVREPLLDFRLVCFAFSLPETAKIGGGFSKRVLRDAMKGKLIETVRTRRSKMGFMSPIAEWRSPRFVDFVSSVWNSKDFQQSAFWRVQKPFDSAELGANLYRAWPALQLTVFKEEARKKRLQSQPQVFGSPALS